VNIKEQAGKLDLEEEEYLELIDLFLKVGMSDLHELEFAVKQGKGEKVASAAHSLKGASANLRLTEIYDSARSLEAKGRSLDLSGAGELVQDIRQKLESIAELVSIEKGPCAGT